MATLTDVLNYAAYLNTLNIHEQPDGSNWAPPITDWAQQYGYSYGDAWCSWTTSKIIFTVDPALVPGMKPDGYSGAWRTWGQQHGRIIPGPAPGAIDVMEFDNPPDNFSDHVGLVAKVNADGTWVNYEGNHSNRYGLVTRAPGGGLHWFVMPLYGQTPTPQKPKTQEAEMATVTSGISVKEFSGIFNVGLMGGQQWDVWAKAQNPTGNPITVHFACTSNTDHQEKDIPAGANQIVEVQAGPGLKGKGNCLVRISSDTPCVMTFDHRPTA